MSSNDVTLHISIDTATKQWLDEQAAHLGYDSAETFICAWVKAQASAHGHHL
jgi:hypothetical protein